MDDPLAAIRTSAAYKLVVAGMAVASANFVAQRLNLNPRPIEQKDVIGVFVAPPGQFERPVTPGVNLMTSNFMFIFHEGKLLSVMNTKTNIEEVEHYREWASMPSLIDSNGAYRLATNWLSRVFVDVSTLNRKYKVTVGQPSFLGDEGANSTYPANWGHVGTNRITLPLYYVTWNNGDYEAAKVGVFGPTKQFVGLTIRDESLTDRVYLTVTNQKELVDMTNLPVQMMSTNGGLLRLFQRTRPPPENAGER
jgi:hypothetical protein